MKLFLRIWAHRQWTCHPHDPWSGKHLVCACVLLGVLLFLRCVTASPGLGEALLHQACLLQTQTHLVIKTVFSLLIYFAHFTFGFSQVTFLHYISFSQPVEHSYHLLDFKIYLTLHFHLHYFGMLHYCCNQAAIVILSQMQTMKLSTDYFYMVTRHRERLSKSTG